MIKYYISTILCILLYSLQVQAAPEQLKSYIVVLKESTKSLPDQANETARRHALKLDRTYGHALRGFAARMPEAVLARVKADADVSYVDEDVEINGFELEEAEQSLVPLSSADCSTEPAQVIPWGVKRVGGGVTTSNYRAWVLDSGIDLIACDLNVDVAMSKNFVANETSPNDTNGHGTHVAGIIAAKNNTINTVGVAPGTRVVAVRVLGTTGSGSMSAIIAGLDYVAQKGIPGDVVNMSLGVTGHYQSFHDATNKVANLGLFVVISAGNSSALASGYEPAHVENKNIFTISAVDSKNIFATFSNRGNPPVDFAAPGVSITSLRMGGGTKVMSGTSMAAPHVSGLLLLGVVKTDGTAINDPDGKPDPIAHN